MSVAGSEESRVSGVASGGLHHSTRSVRSKEKEKAELNALINETVRLAFKEKEASREAQTQRLEERRLRERVADQSQKLSAVSAAQNDMKSDQTLMKRIQSLELKLSRSNALIADLQQLNKEMEERFTAQITRLERKLDHGLNSERTKRLNLFNRSTKKFYEDVENLRMSLEESLTFIDERSQKEWTTQSKCLEVLREKIDVALIRRLGYLPTTTSGMGAAHFARGEPEYVYVKGREVAIEEVSVPSTSVEEGEDDNVESKEERAADAALESKISTFFAEGPPRTRKWDMDMDIDSEYGPRSATAATAKPASPVVKRPPLPAFVDAGNDPVGGAMYNQGLDAHHIIHSMDSRIDEVSKHIAMLTKARAVDDLGATLLSERKARQRGVAGTGESDEYPGSEERSEGEGGSDLSSQDEASRSIKSLKKGLIKSKSKKGTKSKKASSKK